MAEELKRHGIKFSLDLNKHPKDATNLSLINAENFKVSSDGSLLVSDKSLSENITIKNKLYSIYKDDYKIIHCISSNEELVLFVISNHIENKYYDLDLFRYSEKLNTCSDSIIPEKYEKMKYYGGKFSGTFTYNAKNELIIAFCEYDSIYETDYKLGEPLKTINLGYWDVENKILKFEFINLNPITFPISPEVKIPQMINNKLIKGIAKKGWYHFYIRYKIDAYNYTSWFDFGKSIYVDLLENKNIFTYRAEKGKDPNDLTNENNVDLNININLNTIMSDDLDICNNTISFDFSNLDDTYEEYQIAFTCSTKTYNECKISNDILISINSFILNFDDFIDYDKTELIKVNKNFYNVKNIINYNNRLYISNYKEFKFENTYKNNIIKTPIYEDVKTNIITEEETSKIKIIDFYYTAYYYKTTDGVVKEETIRENKLINLDEENKCYLNDIVNDTLYFAIVYPMFRTITPTYNSDFLTLNDVNRVIENFKSDSSDFQITIIEYKYINESSIPGTSTQTVRIDLNNYKKALNDIFKKHNYVQSLTINGYFLNNITGNITYQYNENNNSIKRIYPYPEYTAFYAVKKGENGYYIDYHDKLFVGNHDYVKKYYRSEYFLTPYNFNSKISLRDINYSMIPVQPYNFYIHYINKYGEVSDGYPLISLEDTFTNINNNYYLELNNSIENFGIYINLFTNIFQNYNENITVTSENVINFINTNAIYIKRNINISNDEDVEHSIEIDCLLSELISNEEYSTEIKYYIYDIVKGYLWNLFSNRIKANDNYNFGEILYTINSNSQKNRNLYISRNKDVCIILGQDSLYETICKLKLDNIELPENITSYFISYEKLDNVIVQQGVIKKGNFNINNSEIRLEDINSIYKYLYSDALNYKDTINLNIESISEFDYMEPETDGFTLNFVKRAASYYKHLYDIEELTYRVAGEIASNNSGKSTNLQLKYKDSNLPDISYSIGVCYKNYINLYGNINKTLIRCSEISNKNSQIITTYSHWGWESAIVIDSESYRLTPRNILNTLKNDNVYKNGRTMICNMQFLQISNDFPESKQFNNPPKTFFTVLNDVDFDDRVAKYNQNLLFLPQDTVDIYKNISLNHDDSVISIYSNFNKYRINNENYDKTIYRSEYIKDESLQNGFKIFNTEAYKNINENKGKIVRIEGIGNLLLVHTEHSLFQFDKNNLLTTINKTVQLGEQDTFETSYKELFTSTYGFGGLQDKEAAIVGEFGYIWYNNDFNKIFRYDNGSVNIISNNIDYLLTKYKPTKCKFVDDYFNKRLIIQFKLINNQILNITYNYDINSFISFYINDDSLNDVINETYNTKTKFYILENNKIFDDFDSSNAKKLSIIINEDYTKIKKLEFIKYKLYKRINNKFDYFNANFPVEGNALSTINNSRPYSGYKIRIYNDLCDTGELDIQIDEKSLNNVNVTKPYYSLGNFTFNYLRDKSTNTQIFGNFFIVEFIFNQEDNDIIEFESLEYKINYEEN